MATKNTIQNQDAWKRTSMHVAGAIALALAGGACEGEPEVETETETQLEDS